MSVFENHCDFVPQMSEFPLGMLPQDIVELRYSCLMSCVWNVRNVLESRLLSLSQEVNELARWKALVSAQVRFLTEVRSCRVVEVSSDYIYFFDERGERDRLAIPISLPNNYAHDAHDYRSVFPLPP